MSFKSVIDTEKLLPGSNKLQRNLGLFPVTNIVIANIIGAGIFTTSGFIIGMVESPFIMLILWIIGGLISFCGSIAFGELGANYPEAGGEYVFISRLFNPMLGFLSGWLSLIVGFSAPVAASAIGFSEYFSNAFPGFGINFLTSDYVTEDLFKKLVAVFIIIIFTIIHSRGIVFGSKVQNFLTVLKVLLIVILVIAGFLFGSGNMNNLTTGEPFEISFGSLKSVGLSLMFVMFAYSGWNSATYIGSEIRNPSRIIPISLFISTGIVTILYVLLNLFFIYSVPAEKMSNVTEIAGLASGMAFGTFAEKSVSLLISFALLSSLSAFIILGPRVYFSMTKAGYFFDFAAKIHPHYKVPVGAIILQGALAIVLVLSGTFEQILVYMGFSLGIFPILAVLGVFKLRMKRASVLKLPGYPVAHILFIIAGVAMLVLSFFERPVESSVAILTTLTGIPVYFWFKKRKVRT